ncbi:MAG: M16 family metallopeptidase [Gemmatimonadaceae bacterium]
MSRAPLTAHVVHRYRPAMRDLSLAISVVFSFAAAGAHAQAYDHTKAPRLGRPARLVVPPVTAASLPNGVKLRVIEQRELPLIQITVIIDGGARLDDTAPGMATFMAGMLDEGAGTRDAAALQAELAYLGANLSTAATWDGFAVSLKVPVRSLGSALDLMADVVRRPAFSAAEVRRQRDLRLASLLQQKDQPNALAALAFNQVVFPTGHPYHRSSGGDSASTTALDSASVRQFYDRTIRPERATFIVVGDVGSREAWQAIESRFGGWKPVSSGAPTPVVSAAPRVQTRTQVYLIDKPDAAQSVINIGWPGVDRTTPEYPALMVMNTLLGGSFTSRLNMNLRETKGYSYGARSGFTFRRAAGPFTASAAVRTNVTDSSLVEFFKELRRMRDEPVTGDELERAKAYVELALPGSLETTTQVAGQLAELHTFGLTLDDLPRFAAAVQMVTVDAVRRVARKYLTPDQATVVVVGDLGKVRASIEALNLGPTVVLNLNEVAR